MMQQIRRKITLERVYPAPIEEVWRLWTTSDGLEAWWGPDGFEVEVRELDARVGGGMRYAMRAVGADQIGYLKKAGMPVVSEHRITYTALEAPRLLAFKDVVDFIPGVPAYEVSTWVELETVAGGVRLVLTFEAMHDDHWTRLAAMGKEMELDKLSRVFTGERPSSA
jgi:uncharacterized protein YndB with AHSA1/START domain